MKLKPRLSPLIAMTLGGFFIFTVGLSAWSISNYENYYTWIVMLLGSAWIIVSIKAIQKREHQSIEIKQAGISLPVSNVFEKQAEKVFIPKDEIKEIKKHQSIKGRFIELITVSGQSIHIQARRYCDLDSFIKNCKKEKLIV